MIVKIKQTYHSINFEVLRIKTFINTVNPEFDKNERALHSKRFQ